MGFFKKLGQAIGRGIGAVAEAVGRVTCIEPLEDWGRQMKIRCNPAARRVDLSDSSSYQSQDVIDLHSLCEQVRKEAEAQSKDLEQRCIDLIRSDVDAYRGKLEDLFDEDAFRSFDYEVDRAFIDSIHSTFSSYVARKISQDNPEFVRILREPDSTRTQSCRRYLEQVIKEAWNRLRSSCYNKKAELYRRMHGAVADYLDNQEEMIHDYHEQLVQLRDAKKRTAEQTEQTVDQLVETEHYLSICALTK